jgi:hypothetical protein
MGTGGGKSGRDMKLTTHLQLVLRSKKYGSIHPLPHMLKLTDTTEFSRSVMWFTNDMYILYMSSSRLSIMGSYLKLI